MWVVYFTKYVVPLRMADVIIDVKPALVTDPPLKKNVDEIPIYVLIFMLFMASSYYTGFFPQHTSKLILEQPIARHILGYSILVTSIAGMKPNEKTPSILGISAISYMWCYLMSRQGPISFSTTVLLLVIAHLLNRDSDKMIFVVLRRGCLSVNCIIVLWNVYQTF